MTPIPVSSPSSAPGHRELVIRTLGIASDTIGAMVAGANWEEVAKTIVIQLSRVDESIWPEDLTVAEVTDFWTRSRGEMILAQAIADLDCYRVEYNSCFALMMLVGNMPLPTDPGFIDRFFDAHFIKQFVNDNKIALADRLGRVRYHRVYGSLSEIQTGMFIGYAKNWALRFPQIFESNPDQILSHIVDHAIYRVRMSGGRIGNQINLNVDRNNVIASSTNQLITRQVGSIRHGISRVEYINEASWGQGLRDEWFSLVELALQTEVFRRRQSGTGPATGPVVMFDKLDPSRAFTDDELRFIGRYFALCIIHKRPTGLDFPLVFFKHLLSRPLTITDITEIEPDLVATFGYVANARTQGDFDDLMIDEIPRSDLVEPLSFENKDAHVARAILNIVTNDQPDLFARIAEGFREILPKDTFREMGLDMMKKLLCGEVDFTADELLSRIDFTDSLHSSWTRERKEWMVQMIQGFNQERLRKLLRFVTGYNTPPVGGIAGLDSRISFQAFRPDDLPRRLPRAHTCFKSLDMPQYNTREEMTTIFTNVVDFGNFAGMDER